MKSTVFRIRAKNALPGMILCFENSLMDVIIDDVAYTRDGDIRIDTGYDGSGTNFYDADEYISVSYGI